jgi:hypothetical protein
MTTKTEPWELEDLSVRQAKNDGDWTITAGGGQQPAYKITAAYLDIAVNELIQQVTRDAIADEAREWMDLVTITQQDIAETMPPRIGVDL